MNLLIITDKTEGVVAVGSGAVLGSIVFIFWLMRHKSQSSESPNLGHPHIHNNKQSKSTADSCSGYLSSEKSNDAAYCQPHNNVDKTASCLVSPNKLLYDDGAYEREACYKTAKKYIRAGQEAAIWIPPLISYLAIVEANRILNPHTIAEWLTIAIPLWLLSPCLSILVAAAWTILVVSWYFPCAMLPNVES
jgi:hypothetical protein